MESTQLSTPGQGQERQLELECLDHNEMKLVLWGCCVLVSALKAANSALSALVLQGVLMLGEGVSECPGKPCVEVRPGQLVTMAVAFQSQFLSCSIIRHSRDELVLELFSSRPGVCMLDPGRST